MTSAAAAALLLPLLLQLLCGSAAGNITANTHVYHCDFCLAPGQHSHMVRPCCRWKLRVRARRSYFARPQYAVRDRNGKHVFGTPPEDSPAAPLPPAELSDGVACRPVMVVQSDSRKPSWKMVQYARAGVVGALSVALRQLHEEFFGGSDHATALPLPVPPPRAA